MKLKEMLKTEKWSAFFYAEAFRDGMPFFIGTILIYLYLQVSGMLYEGFTGHSIWAGTSLTLFKAVYTQIIKARIVQEGSYRILMISALMPIFYCYAMFLSYKAWKWKGIECVGIFTAALLAWLVLADTFFSFAMSRRLILGSPFDILRYGWFNHDSAIHKDISMAFFMSGLPIAAFLMWFIGRGRNKKIYGDAHFAAYAEIQRAGLFKKEGVYLGKAYNRNLFKDGFEHVILFAPTGGYKTTSESIPNLFHWKGSCVCTDIKMTLFNLTSLYRQSLGQEVYLWNPASEEGLTHCYNPLDYISRDPLKRIDDIQRIAYILIPDNPNAKDPFWGKMARQLLIALIHYVIGNPKYLKTLGEINRLAKSYASFDGWISHVLENEDIHMSCRNSLHSFLDTPEVTRQSIKETMLSHLSLFDNPYIEAATSRSDFDLRDIRKKAMTIYIGVPDGSLERLAPLVSIFYEQLIHETTESVPDIQKEPHGVLLLIDEFGRLNRMESFKSITTFREFRIRIFVILQEVSQLYAVYGRDIAKLFLNAKIKMAYTPNDLEVSQYLESCLGTTTVTLKNESRKLNAGLLSSPDISESAQKISRPLMLAQEIRELPSNKSLIMIEGGLKIYADKVPWFKDKYCNAQIKGKIEVPDISELVRDLFDRATRISKRLQAEKNQNQNQNKEKIRQVNLKKEKEAQAQAESASHATAGATSQSVQMEQEETNNEDKNENAESLVKDKAQDKLICIVADQN